MVRSFNAAWLFMALAMALPLRAAGEEPSRGFSAAWLPKIDLAQRPNGAFTAPPEKYVHFIGRLVKDDEPTGEPRPLEVIPSPTHQSVQEAWPGLAPGTELPAERKWHDYFTRACVPHCDPNDPERYMGFGQPLLDTSWRNRPFHFDLFAGGLIGDELQEGIISQGSGFFAGGRFGGDFDHYWGLETRLAFSDTNTNFAAGGYGQSRDSFFDASLLYYPWGDSRWRPYLTLGLGVASYRYETPSGTKISAGALEMPFGGGLKYLLMPNLALRFDLIDNFSFPGGAKVDALHNISFTGGIELRFGGRRTSYGSW